MHRMQSGGWPYSKVGRDSDLRKHRLFVQLFFVQLFFVQLSFVRRSCVVIDRHVLSVRKRVCAHARARIQHDCLFCTQVIVYHLPGKTHHMQWNISLSLSLSLFSRISASAVGLLWHCLLVLFQWQCMHLNGLVLGVVALLAASGLPPGELL